MAFTEQELEKRKKGIGASEAASVLGLNPYRTPLDVWMQKKGILETQETPAMRLGTRLEPVVAEMYQDYTGLILIPSGTLVYPKNNILFATPDRIVKGKNKGLEIKTANSRMAENWGEEGTDEIPQYYLIQCVLCMAVTDLPEWDVAALIGGQDFKIYNIQRDIDLETSIIDRLLEWWETYIVGNREPDIDSSRVCADYLANKYPRNFKPLKEASDVEDGLLQRLEEVQYSKKSFEDQEESIKNLLKNSIGESDGIVGSHWKATWKASKDGKKILWEDIAKILLNELKPESQRQIIKDNTQIVPGARRFLFTKK